MASMFRSTGIVALSTLVSRIFGFIREMLFASFFGATSATDAFFVAFRIPNLLRRLVAEGSLTISFIPVYTDYLVNRTRDEAEEVAVRTLSLLLLIVSALVAAGIIFSPQIISVFALGFDDAAATALAVDLNRIMFPYLLMVSVAAFCMGYLNSHNHFFAPAFSPVLLNLGIITGILVLSAQFVEPLYGVALGVLVGGVFQVLLQIPYMKRNGFSFKFVVDVRHPGIQRIFMLIAPATFGIAVYQINIFMSTILASMLPHGSISYLYYSDRLTEIVLGVFIVSIGNVLLPGMSRVSAARHGAEFRDMYLRALGAAMFLALPAAVALMVLGKPVISVLFMRGAFTPFEVNMTYGALLFASLGIGPLAILRITTPTFYALQDTKSPVAAAFVAFFVNITLGYILMHTVLAHRGLALANSISVLCQTGILLYLLKKRIGDFSSRKVIVTAVKVMAASLVMGGVIWAIAGFADWEQDPFSKRALVLSVAIISGSLVYFAAARLLRIGELMFVLEKLTKR